MRRISMELGARTRRSRLPRRPSSGFENRASSARRSTVRSAESPCLDHGPVGVCELALSRAGQTAVAAREEELEQRQRRRVNPNTPCDTRYTAPDRRPHEACTSPARTRRRRRSRAFLDMRARGRGHGD